MFYSSLLFQRRRVFALMAALVLSAPTTTMARPITASGMVVTEPETPPSRSSSRSSSRSPSRPSSRPSSSNRLRPPTQPSEAPPPAPANPPPNQTQPGGGLDAAVKSCHSADLPLTALVPVANPVFTASAHPTFLFYLPDEPDVIDYAEFIVLSADEKEQVYAAQFMPARSGIVSVSLPSEAAHALDFDRAYHWYLSVYCQGAPNALTANILTVNGWVQRISPRPDTAAVPAVLAPATTPVSESTPVRPTPTAVQPADLALPILWYDAIAEVADALALNTQPNTQQQVQWTHWLTTIGLGAIADQPIVGPVRLQSADTAQSNNSRATQPANRTANH